MTEHTETAAAKAAIAQGHADVLASRVTPRAAIARRTGVPAASDQATPRSVVWSDAARDVLVDTLARLAAHDPARAAAMAQAIDGAAADLGRLATGVEGQLPFTYEKVVPQTSYVLAFELVTWTKAGEVIAILHLFEAARDIGAEVRLWP